MAAKDVFLSACDEVGWMISDTSPALADLAEHLFDHAGRGSDRWSMIMVRARDGASCAEAGGSKSDILVFLEEATFRAQSFGIALPGAA